MPLAIVGIVRRSWNDAALEHLGVTVWMTADDGRDLVYASDFLPSDRAVPSVPTPQRLMEAGRSSGMRLRCLRHARC